MNAFMFRIVLPFLMKYLYHYIIFFSYRITHCFLKFFTNLREVLARCILFDPVIRSVPRVSYKYGRVLELCKLITYPHITGALIPLLLGLVIHLDLLCHCVPCFFMYPLSLFCDSCLVIQADFVEVEGSWHASVVWCPLSLTREPCGFQCCALSLFPHLLMWLWLCVTQGGYEY